MIRISYFYLSVIAIVHRYNILSVLDCDLQIFTVRCDGTHLIAIDICICRQLLNYVTQMNIAV